MKKLYTYSFSQINKLTKSGKIDTVFSSKKYVEPEMLRAIDSKLYAEKETRIINHNMGLVPNEVWDYWISTDRAKYEDKDSSS